MYYWAPHTSREERETLSKRSNIYKRTWRNWAILASVMLITSLGLATAIPPLLEGRITNPWPWLNTDLALIIGLCVVLVFFVVYMTQQQRRVLSMHKQLQWLQRESEDRIRLYTTRIYALSSVGHMMGSVSNLQSIFDYITEMCGQTFNSSRASLMLYDRDTGELVVRSVNERDGQYDLLDRRQKIGEGIAGWVAKNKKALLLGDSGDAERYPDLDLKDDSILSAMVVPIVARDELVGVLNVSSRSKDVTYSEEDLLALQVFAENAGVCIRHNEQANLLRQMVPTLREDG